VIDTSTPGSSCENFANFPQNTLSAVGSAFYGDKPFVCGGHNATTFFSDCFIFQDGAWAQTLSLTTQRYKIVEISFS
jgi:hypothetical protein